MDGRWQGVVYVQGHGAVPWYSPRAISAPFQIRKGRGKDAGKNPETLQKIADLTLHTRRNRSGGKKASTGRVKKAHNSPTASCVAGLLCFSNPIHARYTPASHGHSVAFMPRSSPVDAILKYFPAVSSFLVRGG